jgi:transcriptional regulator with XRE-family HTH domain
MRKKTPPQDAAPTDESVTGHLCKRLKQLRAERNWSLDSLATASGVSRSMLSQIERGRANPTLGVTFRIARAFGMSLAEFLQSPQGEPAIEVIRSHDKNHIYRSDADCQIRTLSPLDLEKDVEFYEVQLHEGRGLRSAPHFEGTREFLTVQKGKVRVESADHTEELSLGDSASYRADVPHAIINIGRGEAVVFLVDIYR